MKIINTVVTVCKYFMLLISDVVVMLFELFIVNIKTET